MTGSRADTGLLDTSVVIDPRSRTPLPASVVISTISLAELAVGPTLASDPVERARRQAHLQLVEATFDALPFDVAAARAYGQISAASADAGRKARGRRAVDLLIAATALAEGLPLYTRNAAALRGLERLLEIVDCST